jgi:cytochrome P450
LVVNIAGATVPVPDHVPPGAVVNFDVYEPPGLQAGFHQAWLTLQKAGVPDLVWTPCNGGHWLATNGRDIAEFIADYEHFSSRIMQVPRERSIGNSPIPGSLDPPVQVPFHAVVGATLSARAVEAMEGSVRQLARTLVDATIAAGGCEFVSQFALVLPLTIFMRQADLPTSDLGRLRQLVEEKVRPSGKMSAGDVMRALAEYLDPYITQRMAHPRNDLISRLVSGKVFGRSITHDEATRLCSQALVAGLDTVAGVLAFTTLFLARTPALRQRICNDPSLIPAAVEEFLRRFPLVAQAREVVADYRHNGILLKKGDLIVLPTMLHGLDERCFSNPMEINLARPRAVNSTFGQGPHRCPGSFLARAELRIFLEEWIPRVGPFKVGDEQAVKFQSGVVGTLSCLPIVLTAAGG